MLIVDSIQAIARSPGYAHIDSMRGRVDAVMADLRNATSSGSIVIATSEVGRAFYKCGSDAPPDPLAAAKESGGVEYAVDLLLVLASVPGSMATSIDREKPDGRPRRMAHATRSGPRSSCRSEQARCAPSKDDREAIAEAAQERTLARLVGELPAALVRSRAPVTSLDALFALIRGMAATRRAAIHDALADGVVIAVPDTSRRKEGSSTT